MFDHFPSSIDFAESLHHKLPTIIPVVLEKLNGHAIWSYCVPKVLYLFHAKGTLGPVAVQPLLPQLLQDLPEVVLMHLWSGAVDEDVVHVYHNKLVHEWSQDIVHEPLKRGWGVTQPKRHHCELVVPVSGPESCLLNVLRDHSDLMVPTAPS